MSKEITKKHTKKPNVVRFDNVRKKTINTIMVTIILVIVSMVSLVSAVMYCYSKESIKGLQNDLSADFISQLQVFNDIYYADRIQEIQRDLNSVVSGSYRVKYAVVFDSNMKQVYSSIPPNSYELIDSMGKLIFKLKKIPGVDVKSIKTIRIEKNDYIFYLGISTSPFIASYLNQISSFVVIFLSLILIASLIISYLLARSISNPLSEMEKTISKIGEGDLSGRLEYTRYDELNHLVESYNMMANALQRMYSTLEVQVQERTKELKSAYSELQNTQAMMVHSEKMKSLGELVAGIMHEINNPINFIYGNMTHLSNYSNDLINIIEEYTKFASSLKPEEKEEVEKLKEEIDYEFLKSDMPDLIKSCKEGADRAKNIIQDLKSFSRMEEVAITDVDLVHELETTLNILHNKLKNKAVIHKEYKEPIPKIEAFGGQLNQVFMNILDNAAGAIEKYGDIWIRINTDEKANNVVIEIEDNGIGMDEETARKVFDPFFTTKPVGQGTGLGMSITHKIIKNHQGTITLQSKKGEGSKFTIKLPLKIDRESLNAGILAGE